MIYAGASIVVVIQLFLHV